MLELRTFSLKSHVSIIVHASLYFTSSYFTSLYFTSLHFTFLHFTSLHFTSLFFTSLHFTFLHFTSLHFFQLWGGGGGGGAYLVGDVVGHKDDVSACGAFGGVQAYSPPHHSNGVLAQGIVGDLTQSV